MKKNEYEGLPLYSLSAAQDVYMLQFKYSLHKAVLHVPSCIVVDHPLDWALMEQALNIEIERNDCMRLHFVKTKEGLRQYYIPEYSISHIPVDDFRGMDEEEAKKLLHKRGSHPVLDYLHGEVFRVRFFYAHDGRCGVYLNASHLNMDLAAEFLFYRDLFGVYDALENKTELPAPLGSSEELLKRDLERMANVQKHQKDEKFYNDFFSEDAHQITFTGIDGTRLLEKSRKKRKNPKLRYPSIPIILFDRSDTVTYSMDASLVSKMYAFLEKQNMTLSALFCLGFRTYLSARNYRLENVYHLFNVNHRSTLMEINCGGARAVAIPLITSIKEDCTFKDAMAEVSKTMMRLFAHSDFPFMETDKIISAKMEDADALSQKSSMNFSCMPPVPFPEKLKDWNFDFSGFSNGYFSMLNYTIAVPNMRTGEIQMYYEYNTHYVPKESILEMHNSIIKVFEAGINNPDITIGQIMDSL